MKRYLNEMEAAGLVLIVVGIFCTMGWGARFGAWPATVGMLLWLTVVVYKAFHWQQYERQNKQNISIMLIAIVILLIQMMLRR